MFSGHQVHFVRAALLTGAVAFFMLAMFLPHAKAEIEDAVVECRKTCVEQQCVAEYQTCMTKALGSPQSCRSIRQDCERSCVAEQCLP